MALTMLPKITAEVNFVMQIKHNLLICRLSYDLSTSLYTPLPASFTTASDNEMADENYNFVRLMREREAMEGAAPNDPNRSILDANHLPQNYIAVEGSAKHSTISSLIKHTYFHTKLNK